MGNSSSELRHASRLCGELLESRLALAGTSFVEWHQIDASDSSHPESVYAADLDGDGDDDVLSGWLFSKIVWYENTDGRGTFGPQHVITTSADIARSIYAADLDGDGDIDVLSTDRVGEKVAWYENTDGRGTFGPQRVITTSADSANSVYAADLDGDGDIDVLSASFGDDKVAWYENTDGRGTFGPQRVITTSADYTNSVYAADLDGDGDVDVLSAIAWYENTDGRGTFGAQHVIVDEMAATSVFASDLDGDSDIDVITVSYDAGELNWYEQLGSGGFPQPGDANEDRHFDQLDIIQVLQNAEYLTKQPADWGEGDWNGDGVFDQLDVIAALETGNYLRGPYAAVDAVFTGA